MTKTDKKMVDKNLDLIFEFEKYILEHPDFAEHIPEGATLVMQVEGDEEFNRWSRRLGKKQMESGQSVVYITIKKMSPARSRIEKIEMEVAA